MTTELPSVLLRPTAYSHHTETVQLVETHLSWVFLTGKFAYKVKKPVCFDFVNFSTLSLREHFCHEELRLNRQFSPELYLRVVPIVRLANGNILVEPTDQHTSAIVIEWAVKMVQFDSTLEADHLVETDKITNQTFHKFGVALADLHSRLPSVNHAPNIADDIQDNFDTLLKLQSSKPLHSQLYQLEAASRSDIERRGKLLELRIHSGKVRECHADLHLSNLVLIKGTLQAFDCLEFDTKLRTIDVWNDAAFLFMDCCVRNRTDLAYSFVDGYLNHSGDYEGVTLLPLYSRYRSMVRAKVAALALNQTKQNEFRKKLEKHILWTQQNQTRGTGQLIVTCGVSGAGKSYWASRLVPELGAIRLRSDVLRKHRQGLDSNARTQSAIGEGLYAAEQSKEVYQELADFAFRLLVQGEQVIIDAACLKQNERHLFAESAAKSSAKYIVLHFTANESELRRRIAKRACLNNDVSEATQDVLTWQLQHPVLPIRNEPLIEVDSMSIELSTLVKQINDFN